MLEKAGQGALGKYGGRLFVAAADAVDECLGDGSDIFAVLAQWEHRKPDGGQAEGEVGQEIALAGKLSQRGVRRDQEKKARSAGWITRAQALERFNEVEEQALPRGGEQVDAVEVESAGKGCGIRFVGQPFASVAAAKGEIAERRLAVEGLREEVLASAGLTFNGRDVETGSGDFSLEQQPAQRGADANKLSRLLLPDGGGMGGDRLDC